MLRNTEKGKLTQEKEVENVGVEVATSDLTSRSDEYWQFCEGWGGTEFVNRYVYSQTKKKVRMAHIWYI